MCLGGVQLQSLQINFTVAQVQLLILGGGLTAVTADQLHCSPNSTPDPVGRGSNCSHCRSTYCNLGGSDCSHCTSTSLQPNFNSLSWGGGVQLQSLQINFTAAQVQLLILWGGGVQLQSLHINFTATQLQFLIQGGSDCSHCTSTSLQPNFNSLLGGSDCSHCTSTSLWPKFNS